MDILDTSALKALSREELNALSARRKIGVPCYAIWELLCHIDEPVGHSAAQVSFERRKGQLLKARGLELLNDPRSIWLQKIGRPQVAHSDYYLEAAVTRAFLDKLSCVKTLDELYSAEVPVHAARRMVGFKDCASRAREALSSLESEYVSTWAEIDAEIGALEAASEERTVSPPGPMWDLLMQWEPNVPAPGGGRLALDEAAAQALWHLTYCYRAYVQGRVIPRLSISGNPKFKMDGNDMEDSLICGYIDVRANDILITNENETVKILSKAFEEYTSHYPAEQRSTVMRAAAYAQRWLA